MWKLKQILVLVFILALGTTAEAQSPTKLFLSKPEKVEKVMYRVDADIEILEKFQASLRAVSKQDKNLLALNRLITRLKLRLSAEKPFARPEDRETLKNLIAHAEYVIENLAPSIERDELFEDVDHVISLEERVRQYFAIRTKPTPPRGEP